MPLRRLKKGPCLSPGRLAKGRPGFFLAIHCPDPRSCASEGGFRHGQIASAAGGFRSIFDRFGLELPLDQPGGKAHDVAPLLAEVDQPVESAGAA